jgi:hypothetical protein
MAVAFAETPLAPSAVALRPRSTVIFAETPLPAEIVEARLTPGCETVRSAVTPLVPVIVEATVVIRARLGVTVLAPTIVERIETMFERISTTIDRHPEAVPPTLTFVDAHDVTPPFVSNPDASSVVSTTLARSVIPLGGVSRAVSTERCPAKPATHAFPLVSWRVSAG